MRPIIGITAGRGSNSYGQRSVVLTDAYLQAISQAGGTPVVIPSMNGGAEWELMYERLNGILFSGGGDIAPERFGDPGHPRVDDVEPDRDELEVALLRAAASDGKPFLGICRGCQLVNVALGGNLYTHIPDQLKGALDHDYPGSMRHILAHHVKIDEGTRLGEIMDEPLLGVNSHHHQGLKDVAAPLRAAGHSRDGLVEAVELQSHPFGLAVQWHPEWLTAQVASQRLFSRFVEAASQS